jgi:hypothetical protein
MWLFRSRRKRRRKHFNSGSDVPSLRLSVHVIASLRPGYVRVKVGEGIGLVDYHEVDWPIEWVPEAARKPNGAFTISGFVDGVPQVMPDPAV